MRSGELCGDYQEFALCFVFLHSSSCT